LVTPATSELSPLSLHDALPISSHRAAGGIEAAHQARMAGYEYLAVVGRDGRGRKLVGELQGRPPVDLHGIGRGGYAQNLAVHRLDRKSTRLNSSHVKISYAVFC